MDGEYKDKKAGLIVMGIFEILGGLFCGIFFALSLLSLAVLGDEISTKQTLIGSSVRPFLRCG